VLTEGTTSMRVSGRFVIALMLVLLLAISLLLLLPTPTDNAWNVQTVDTKATRNGVSIAVDSGSNPHICFIASETGSYYYEGSYILTPKFLTYANWNGSSWNSQTVDPQGTPSVTISYDSLVLDSNDAPHIVYSTTVPVNQTESAYILKYATLKEAEWAIQTIDYGDRGAIKIDSKNNPHIAYSGVNRELKYASWTGTNWNLQTVDPDPKSDSSETEHYLIQDSDLAVDSDDHPNIIYWLTYTPPIEPGVYYPEGPRTESIIKWARMDSSSWTIRTVISDANVSTLGNVVLDSRGYPHFTYNNGWNHSLMYESWNGNAWIGQNVTTIRDGYAGFLRLDHKNDPYITHYKEGWEENGTHISAIYYTQWKNPIWWNDAAWDSQIVEADYTLGYSEKYSGSYTLPLVLDSKGNPHTIYLLLRESLIPSVYGLLPRKDATIVYASRTQPAWTVPAEVKFALLIFLLALALGLLIAAAYYRKRRLGGGK
jgi:hypothetical protein